MMADAAAERRRTAEAGDRRRVRCSGEGNYQLERLPTADEQSTSDDDSDD